MTLFTLIWGACMLYGFTRKNMNAMVAMTLLFMTFQCANVISFGGFSVGPQILTSMCLIVRFLIFSKFRVYKTKYNNLVNVLLVVLVIEVIISALYNNVISKNYLYILQLTTYVLCFVVLRYSTHIEGLQKFVVEKGLDVGFAYDGDADRCLCVDEKGNVITGDHILYIYGCYMKERGKLLNNTVVTTVMSNFGLYKAFDEQGIGYAKTAVGDKYVYEYMAKNGCRIGGEQSGHIIFHQ
mgnify:CR=1 FL=1